MQSQLGVRKVERHWGPNQLNRLPCWPRQEVLGPSLGRWHGEPETTSRDAPSSSQILVLAGCGAVGDDLAVLGG